MKKLLVAVLACALFVPAFAAGNVYVTGDIQTIGLAMEGQGVNLNAGTIDDVRGVTNRTLLGLVADLAEDVQAKLTFDYESVWGDGMNKGDRIQQIWQRAQIAEAYVKIANVFDALEVKVGRQFYGDVDSLAMYFGPDYGSVVGNTYSSLDGLTARYNGENLTLTAAYLNMYDTGALNAMYDDIFGLDLDYKFSDTVSASAYVYDARYMNADHWGFWGVKPVIENDNFKLAGEYVRNYGQHEKGWLVKGDLALTLGTDETSVTPRVTYIKTEKGYEAFGNFRPRFVGVFFGTLFPAVFRGGGVDWELLNAGLDLKFAGLEKWDFALDFYTMELEKHFNGNSWEAKVTYNVNQYVAFNVIGAVLSNKKHFTASPTALQFGMNVKF